jgi:hypothetical protein
MYHFPFFHFFTGAFGLTIAALCIIPYFLPTIVAALRNHPNAGAIFVVNFLLGWTLLAWILCLVWAASSTNRYAGPYPPYNPGSDSQDRIINQLRQLQQLRDEGALTEEEFNRQKSALLR